MVASHRRWKQSIRLVVGALLFASCTPFDTLGPDAGADRAPETGAAGATSEGRNPGNGPDASIASDLVDAADTPISVDTDSATALVVGAACHANGECTSGQCADGVCCGSSCATACLSCVGAQTGQDDGICAPVKPGQAHANDCPRDATRPCGFDGKCDGAGACRFVSTATPCQGESCILGMHSQGGSCDGAGTCRPEPATSCGNYACTVDKVHCSSACGIDAECANGAYCSASACAARLSSGRLCTRSGECASGNCSGRCCAASMPCTCTQPNPMNVLKNAGFDIDASGWDVTQAKWTSVDAEGCPFSGSLSIPDNQSLLNGLAQCVPVAGNRTYRFGALFKGTVSSFSCSAVFRDASDCVAGNIVATLDLPGTPALSPDVWTEVSASGTVSDQAKSAYVLCYAFGLLVDHMYLSPAPLTY
jgi:hypothetical protein